MFIEGFDLFVKHLDDVLCFERPYMLIRERGLIFSIARCSFSALLRSSAKVLTRHFILVCHQHRQLWLQWLLPTAVLSATAGRGTSDWELELVRGWRLWVTCWWVCVVRIYFTFDPSAGWKLQELIWVRLWQYRRVLMSLTGFILITEAGAPLLLQLKAEWLLVS